MFEAFSETLLCCCDGWCFPVFSFSRDNSWLLLGRYTIDCLLPKCNFFSCYGVVFVVHIFSLSLLLFLLAPGNFFYCCRKLVE